MATPITTIAPVTFLELEITGKCQLTCIQCYANSGPDGDTGTMTTGDWKRVIVDAASAGIEAVQFIGGEPTLHPDLPDLIVYALSVGLKVDVYSNLVHVSDTMWKVFELDGVSLGTSWYAAAPEKHAQITGTEGSYYRTRSNIIEARMRGIPIRAGIVEVIDGQDVEAAELELRRLGVTDIAVDRARAVGRASGGRPTTVEDLCGRCGDGRAAILSDGTLIPCVLGRHLAAGNVKDTPLADILTGERWREIVETIPRRDACVTCTPADSNDCNPSRKPR